ncbi:PilW family protein [Pseudomonas alkylphenolica]|uniref:PilW family protein n=1 Tax=Pseudomonas alkylphenolica TaxID=237609 RepID=UPI0018D8ED5E|nr:prepilin-type N-terminal cleavage/methylation domain-containing protein [Pseudomonas alkylphenolica]MBH3428017.1 prepilin-type N-terminal cleavage/methylation domain-containing protein [Pseudomonas alkylphenolica]
MRWQTGFSLLEVLLALSLGLLLLLGASRLFMAASQSWQAQAAAVRMQEDARQALQRLAQSIRMAGMFGCLQQDTIEFDDPLHAEAFAQPLYISHGADGRLQRLSLISAEVTQGGGRPDWTLLTDCRTQARVQAGPHLPGTGQFAVALHRQDYRLVGHQLRLRSGSSTGVLVDGVSDLQLELRNDAVHLSLTLSDPQQRARPQTYRMRIALGNPVANS